MEIIGKPVSEVHNDDSATAKAKGFDNMNMQVVHDSDIPNGKQVEQQTIREENVETRDTDTQKLQNESNTLQNEVCQN